MKGDMAMAIGKANEEYLWMDFPGFGYAIVWLTSSGLIPLPHIRAIIISSENFMNAKLGVLSLFIRDKI
jgi:hypothetical protein